MKDVRTGTKSFAALLLVGHEGTPYLIDFIHLVHFCLDLLDFFFTLPRSSFKEIFLQHVKSMAGKAS
jgi:hypothetical protein